MASLGCGRPSSAIPGWAAPTLARSLSAIGVDTAGMRCQAAETGEESRASVRCELAETRSAAVFVNAERREPAAGLLGFLLTEVRRPLSDSVAVAATFDSVSAAFAVRFGAAPTECGRRGVPWWYQHWWRTAGHSVSLIPRWGTPSIAGPRLDVIVRDTADANYSCPDLGPY